MKIKSACVWEASKKERGKYREGGRASQRVRERFWISCYVTFFMSGETEAEITEAQSHRVFHLKWTQWFRTTSAFSSSSYSSLVVLICSACFYYMRACVCLVCVLCSSCELVSRVSTWMLKMWHNSSSSSYDTVVRCVLAGQRCDKGVNKRIFWRVLNITAKLSQECFAEKYRGI